MRWRSAFVLACAGLLACTGILAGAGAGTAGAQAGSPWVAPAADPAAPAALVQQILDTGMLDATPVEWAPQGTLIADSGFDPRVHGFNFMNYGDSDDALPNLANTVFFDVPYEDPVNLTANDMRTLFGQRACQNRGANCILTLAAEAAMESYIGAMDGGHCLGIAATAAQVFNSELAPRFIGSKFRPAYRTPWSSTMTRTIARNFTYQFANDLRPYTRTPTEVVAELRTALAPGSAPLVLALWETPPGQGGHAILPIALYDRGGGLYDVAVWDNNYPGRIRAVHIDTTADGGAGSMEYLMFTAPGAPPTMASGSMLLIPSGKMLGRQPCKFCDDADGTFVLIDAVEAEDGAEVSAVISTPGGGTIKGLVEYPSLDPPGDGMQTFPMWLVPSGVPFKVTLSTSGVERTVVTAVTAQSGDGTWVASDLVIRPGSRDIVTFRPDRESIAFSSTAGTDPTLSVIDSTDDQTYSVEVRSFRLNRGRTVELDLDFAKDQAVFTSNQRFTRRVAVVATLEGGPQRGLLYSWPKAPPNGYSMTVDFSKWTVEDFADSLAGWLTAPGGQRLDLLWRTRVAT